MFGCFPGFLCLPSLPFLPSLFSHFLAIIAVLSHSLFPIFYGFLSLNSFSLFFLTYTSLPSTVFSYCLVVLSFPPHSNILHNLSSHSLCQYFMSFLVISSICSCCHFCFLSLCLLHVSPLSKVLPTILFISIFHNSCHICLYFPLYVPTIIII